jgi:hypothetical protein
MIDEANGIDWPLFQSQLYDVFGEPNEGKFANDYLRTLDLSEFAEAFAHVLDYTGQPWSHKIYCNFAIHTPLRRAFRLLLERGLARELESFDGCWNIRRMSGGGGLSVHSWALAIDLNAGTNPYGPELITDFSDDFVKCFAQASFEWGGLWSGNKDAMHFQAAWNRDWRESSNPLAPVVWEA